MMPEPEDLQFPLMSSPEKFMLPAELSRVWHLDSTFELVSNKEPVPNRRRPQYAFYIVPEIHTISSLFLDLDSETLKLASILSSMPNLDTLTWPHSRQDAY